MKGIQTQRTQVGGDRLFLTSGLCLKLSKEVMRIRITGIDASHSLERVDSLVYLRGIAVEDAEVVPGPRTLRLPPCRVEQNFACFVVTLSVKESNTLVEARLKQRGIGPPCSPEEIQGLRGSSTIHFR